MSIDVLVLLVNSLFDHHTFDRNLEVSLAKVEKHLRLRITPNYLEDVNEVLLNQDNLMMLSLSRTRDTLVLVSIKSDLKFIEDEFPELEPDDLREVV
jgi:hypothetical protein